MRGVGSPVMGGQQGIPRVVDIVIEKDQYSIGRYSFAKPSDKKLEVFTDEVLGIFGTLRRAVTRNDSIKLDAQFCQEQLVRLAEWGRVAYQAYFGEDRQSKALASYLWHESISPTFVSESIVFPWEMLFGGTETDYEQGNPNCFWGLRYTPARILEPNKIITEYPSEQVSPSDMLFCLHHKLLQAHQDEQPAIERIVRNTSRDRFTLLGPRCKLAVTEECELKGDDFLKYLYKARHNMLHFACHCKESRRGDTLLVSFIQDGDQENAVRVIELETYKFLLRKGQFLQQPLVFLNACQSAGGADELRRTFNLPKVFIEHGAAAVIATACPVPDRFAAAFARKFYEFFLRGKLIMDDETGQKLVEFMTIGEALQETRWYFLKECSNPLGLAYGLYSPAHYQLTR